MLSTFAFDVCHDVYLAAREVIDTKIATLSLESSGKYQWKPDRVPHLAEYVSDFALAGERALGASSGKALRHGHSKLNSVNTVSASRMAMFRVYYLGGADYAAARRHLGISELTWADWSDDIRKRVGRELARSGVFPPSKYFLAQSDARELRATGTDGAR